MSETSLVKQDLSIENIKKFICPLATDQEAYMFLQLCHHRGLNPFIREAYLIKYNSSSPANMVVGKDAFTKKALESENFNGFEAGVIVDTKDGIKDRTGSILFPGDALIGGWAKVYRKGIDRPYEIRVSLSEYDKHQNNWKTIPATMIRKVALVQALREAFPKELGGCYDSSELTDKEDLNK